MIIGKMFAQNSFFFFIDFIGQNMTLRAGKRHRVGVNNSGRMMKDQFETLYDCGPSPLLSVKGHV